MTSLPGPICEYFCELLEQEGGLLYFMLDKKGRILSSGGALPNFGEALSQVGEDITDVLPFMVGIIPLDTPSLLLPFISFGDAMTVDVHIFQTHGGLGVVLMDARGRKGRFHILQQTANELALQRELRYGRS